jgi:lipase chaperone LimK
MSIVTSPFNSNTLDLEEIEEAESNLQDLRILLLKQTSEARVAARGLGDKDALERIATNEKEAKTKVQANAELMAKLVRVAECYNNQGIGRMKPETLLDRANYLFELAWARSDPTQVRPANFVERRKKASGE